QANRRTLHFGIDQGRFEPKWTDHGRIGQAIMVFSLAVHDGKLYAGTCEPGKEQSGRVYRWDGGEKWTDCGAPGKCNSVSSLAVFEGKLYAGTAKYRLAGSALPESDNPNLGGQVFRYDGENKWVACGQLPETEGIGGMAVFQGRLYAGSLYRPAGFFRYEGGERWTPLETPNGKRVEALCVHNDQLFASTYDQAHIFRFDGTTWTDCGQVGDETNTQTYSFAVHYGRLYVGTWRSGKVFRYEADNRWTDCGRLGEELEVMGMLVHNGSLFAGSLPLAQVYRYDAPAGWTNVGQVDATPMVTYRRAWTMAEFQGRLFVGTLPTGRVLSQSAGVNVTYDHEFPAGWHHVAAVRAGGVLRLYVDGRQAAESASFRASDYDLSVDRPLTIGFGPNDYFRGKLHGVRLDARALSGEELRQLSRR
ncbi:MAG TPA: LamG domain-containing protein, partial [Pirellulaceae bacterium]|nr:LamG domain-containing protein [Pirellulaceae bacterium]